MRQAPSEYPNPVVKNLTEEVYKLDCHNDLEQSAIYSNIGFPYTEESSLGIVLTAQCDIQKYGPEDLVLLARLAPALENFSDWLMRLKKPYTEAEVAGEVPISEGKQSRKSVIETFTHHYLQNRTVACYFLPALERKFEDLFVCYDTTQCMLVKDLQPESKMCVLRSPFREAVPSHYSAYIGRIGTPPFEKDFLTGLLERICKLKDA